MVNKIYIVFAGGETMGRRKRGTYADSPIFYKDIFPGYPPGLRMREDVAEFVSLIN